MPQQAGTLQTRQCRHAFSQRRRWDMELQIGMFKHVQEFCKTGISIESIGQKLYGSKTASLQGKIKLSVFQTPPSARLKSALKALARNCMESKTASLQGKIKLSVCQTRLAARQNQIVSISNTRQNQTVRISARKSCMDHNFLGGKEEQRARISRCHYAKFGEGLHT